jgi:Mn2+/Fe2+ NRAMP family transporter
MKRFHGILAAGELAFISPAVLFFASLVVRSLQPVQYEPARTAQQIVDWYAVRPRVGLDLLLVALPFIVLVAGCVLVARAWKQDAGMRHSAGQVLSAVRAHLAVLLIAIATVAAGSILAVVAVHIATD